MKTRARVASPTSSPSKKNDDISTIQKGKAIRKKETLVTKILRKGTAGKRVSWLNENKRVTRTRTKPKGKVEVEDKESKTERDTRERGRNKTLEVTISDSEDDSDLEFIKAGEEAMAKAKAKLQSARKGWRSSVDKIVHGKTKTSRGGGNHTSRKRSRPKKGKRRQIKQHPPSPSKPFLLKDVVVSMTKVATERGVEPRKRRRTRGKKQEEPEPDGFDLRKKKKIQYYKTQKIFDDEEERMDMEDSASSSSYELEGNSDSESDSGSSDSRKPNRRQYRSNYEEESDGDSSGSESWTSDEESNRRRRKGVKNVRAREEVETRSKEVLDQYRDFKLLQKPHVILDISEDIPRFALRRTLLLS